MPKTLSEPMEMLSFLSQFDTFLFDCDGVLWHGSNPIPHISAVLEYLRKAGKRILFVTNNSSKSRSLGIQKFSKFGIQASEDEIFGSAYCAAYYLSRLGTKKVYAIGMQGLFTELDSFGIAHVPSSEFATNVNDVSEMNDVELPSDVDTVLFGLDVHLNYKKLAIAHALLQDPNVRFLATNSDTTFPAGGKTFPGTGALLASLITSTCREPIILGKPHQTMLDCIVDKYHLDREKTCMVGDRLDTDIEFGIMGKLTTLLVMTGVTDEIQLQASPVQPDYIVSSLGDFNKVL
jgi:4-nitrophenyl phosphatase